MEKDCCAFISDALIALAEAPVIGPVICSVLGIFGFIFGSEYTSEE